MISRPHHPARRATAFTLPELAIVLAVIGVLALLAIPAIGRSRTKASHTRCTYNLKNVGLGLRIFSTDNNGAWPWQVSTNQQGSREFLQDPSLAWHHFHALSNELSTPQIFRCPNDLTGTRPAFWRDAATNSAFSYFLGLDAREENPNTILGGDSNLELSGRQLRTALVTLRTNADLRFHNSRHEYPPSGAGNILLSDGGVHSVTSARFREALILPGDPTNSIHRWLIP